MKQCSAVEFLQKPILGEYIYIYGVSFHNWFFVDIMDVEKYKQELFIGALKDVLYRTGLNMPVWDRHDLLIKILKKHNIASENIAKVALIARIHRKFQEIYLIKNILRVDLLDENNNIIDSIKVGESEMPVELRGKI